MSKKERESFEKGVRVGQRIAAAQAVGLIRWYRKMERRVQTPNYEIASELAVKEIIKQYDLK